jgi:hypothetical protein
MPRSLLIAEFLLLFVVLPLLYRFSPLRAPVLPVLWALSGYAVWQLLRDPRFERTQLWNLGALTRHVGPMLAIFAVAALVLWAGVHRFAPGIKWSLVRRRPVLWAIVMIAYPILSVYPQGLLYRAFFFERYQTLFPAGWPMILASAAAFGFMHIIFRNPLAPALTLVGGALFAFRYAQTGSLAASSFEHALYGCWLFSLGLGGYFYHGTIASVETLLRK